MVTVMVSFPDGAVYVPISLYTPSLYLVVDYASEEVDVDTFVLFVLEDVDSVVVATVTVTFVLSFTSITFLFVEK